MLLALFLAFSKLQSMVPIIPEYTPAVDHDYRCATKKCNEDNSSIVLKNPDNSRFSESLPGTNSNQVLDNNNSIDLVIFSMF